MTTKEAFLFIGELMERAYGWHINNRLLGMSIEEFESKCEGMIHLLKAHEPRLMTLDEAEKAGICWLESRSGIIEACRVAVNLNRKKVTIGRISLSPIHVPLENYGRTWRCWTSRPTDEQRKAVKWE